MPYLMTPEERRAAGVEEDAATYRRLRNAYEAVSNRGETMSEEIPTPAEWRASNPAPNFAVNAILKAMRAKPHCDRWAIAIYCDDRAEMDQALSFATREFAAKGWIIQRDGQCQSIASQREPHLPNWRQDVTVKPIPTAREL